MGHDENIRKKVGRKQEKRPLQRVWELRQRLMKLGVEFDNKDERIRKIVSRSGQRQH